MMSSMWLKVSWKAIMAGMYACRSDTSGLRHGSFSSPLVLYHQSYQSIYHRYSLMAYGQTSSGKTHTMLGKIKDSQQCGVMPRALDMIFDAMSKADAECRFNVKASYVELYCERIQDLLDPAKVDLKISETADTGVKITDVTQGR